MARRSSRLTPYQQTKLKLIDELVAEGFNPLNTIVVEGGIEIKFTPEDLARYYAQEGGSYQRMSICVKEEPAHEDHGSCEPGSEPAEPEVHTDPICCG